MLNRGPLPVTVGWFFKRRPPESLFETGRPFFAHTVLCMIADRCSANGNTIVPTVRFRVCHFIANDAMRYLVFEDDVWSQPGVRRTSQFKIPYPEYERFVDDFGLDALFLMRMSSSTRSEDFVKEEHVPLDASSGSSSGQSMPRPHAAPTTSSFP